jgi:hypothetical protein
MTEESELQRMTRHCRQIERYWRNRGKPVEVWLVEEAAKPHADQKARTIYVVKSKGIPVKGKEGAVRW